MVIRKFEREFLKQNRKLFQSNLIAGFIFLALAVYVVLFSRPAELDNSFIPQFFLQAFQPIAGGGFTWTAVYFFKEAAKCPVRIIDFIRSSPSTVQSNDKWLR